MPETNLTLLGKVGVAGRRLGVWLRPWTWWPMQSTFSTFETEQPWVVYHYRTTNERTRVTGRSIIDAECAVCGEVERLRMRIPRFGDVPMPEGGKHVERLRVLRRHVHQENARRPWAWARPLLNPQAHPGGIDLDMLAMRLEADIRDALRASEEDEARGA